jgi:hypothetical protein
MPGISNLGKCVVDEIIGCAKRCESNYIDCGDRIAGPAESRISPAESLYKTASKIGTRLVAFDNIPDGTIPSVASEQPDDRQRFESTLAVRAECRVTIRPRIAFESSGRSGQAEVPKRRAAFRSGESR